MWILISLNEHGQEEGPHFLLHKSKKYTLGRKDCDILINDKSVSRVHAELLVAPLKNPSDANSLAKLTVIDKSKFGTFVNRVRCEQDKEIILKEGDIIVFGVNNSQLKVKYQPIDICFSNVKTEIKASVQTTLSKIGAHVYNDYVPTKITHLVMSELEVTSKVLLALTEGIHVITPQWLLDIEAKNDGLVSPLPNVSKYLPPLKEDECTLSQFKPDPSRKTLFSGKTFVFMTEKQYLKAYRIVETAGGTTVKSFHEHEVTKSPKKKKPAAQVVEKSEPFTVDYLLKNRASCFIDPEDFLSTLSKGEKMVVEQKVKMLKDFDFQLISEDEIGFSVLHSSLEKYCNPTLPAKEKFFVPETKPVSKKVEDKKNVKDVETKSIDLSPKKAPVKTIKDMFKKSTPSAPVTINLDEKSTEEKSSTSIKKAVEKAAEDKKKKQAEEKKKVTEEEKRQADEKAKEEEKKYVAEEKKKAADEKKRLADEKKKQAEEKKTQLEEKKRLAEEEKKQSEEKKKAAEEEKKQAEEKKQKAEEERKRKQAEEAEKKRAAASEAASKAKKSESKKNSKELNSDDNKQGEVAAPNDANNTNKRTKFSLSANRATSSKKISLSSAIKTTSSSKPGSSDEKSDGGAQEEDSNHLKETSSQRKRVIKDGDEHEDKMDLDSNDVAAALADANHQSTPTKDQQHGTKRKRSGSLANSFNESNDKESNMQEPAEGSTNTNATNSSLLATPQSRNVKRFKKSVSPVEKSPRPKIISTEVHDLSKDKKESEIWFKATEKEYTEEEKKQKEADALFAYSMKNPTAATKKKVK